MKRIVILGASGFGREVAWVVARLNEAQPAFEVAGFCDDAEDKQKGECAGYPLLGAIEAASVQFPGVGFHCAVGNNRARKALTARALAAGWEPVTLIDRDAHVAPGVAVAAGSYVGIGSVLSVGVKMGSGVIVNHHVTVGHDTTLGDFSQLCPGACVSGGCVIEEGVLFGTLAGVIPQRRVGAWAVVGAGTMAFQDVAAGATLVRLGRS